MTFDTLYDLCLYFKNHLNIGEILEIEAEVHTITLSLSIYREADLSIKNNFDFVNNIEDGSMQVLICNSLIINEEAVLSPNIRCKGLCIFSSKVRNNGKISMTARGAKAEGRDIYLYHNRDGTYEFVPARGTIGGKSGVVKGPWGVSAGLLSVKPAAAIGRRTGGGAAGAVWAGWNNTSYSAQGGQGTSYSGGVGSGGMHNNRIGQTRWAYGPADNICGQGGTGRVNAQNSTRNYGFGGAGNPDGFDVYNSSSGDVIGKTYLVSPTNSGTGGLLILYCLSLINKGVIEARGSSGRGTRVWNQGGGSGGGSINIFYNVSIEQGTITAAGQGPSPGGDGSVTIQHMNNTKFLIKDSGKILV